MSFRHLTRALLGASATLMVAAGAAPAASGTGLQVSLGNDAHYPARALLVAAPASHTLTVGTVHVTENGAPVAGLTVTPLSTANQGDFGVVVLIDTSWSMRGQPEKQAMIAARSLAAQRTGQQELGAIEFNKSSKTVLPLTTDPVLISRALAGAPKLGHGTTIYDSTLLAIRQLHASQVAAATVIVLSDGADYGSSAHLRQVAAAAAADHVRIYTVGVNDRSFAPRTLAALARATGGSYAKSSARGLSHVFTNIESQLTNRYVVRYRSVQAAGHRITVTMTAAGIPGQWTGTYSSPAAPVPLSLHQYSRALAGHTARSTFWSSTLAVVIVAVASALLLVVGLLIHYVPRSRQQDMRGRIEAFTVQPEPETAAESEERPSQRFGSRLDAQLSAYGWWSRFREEVDVAGIESRAVDVLLFTVIATVASAAVFSLLVGSALVSLPVGLFGPAVMVAIVRLRAAKQREQFNDQLAGHMEEIGAAMRAGHSVIASIASMADDATDPTRREFQRAVADERLGIHIEVALGVVAERMQCKDVSHLALVAELNQRTGGNMAEVLDLIAAGCRDRAELRRELDALTAQARLSRWVVTGLPPAMLLVMAAIRPSYVHPLFHTVGGAIALCAAGALLFIGSTVMRLILASGR
jgi:tight adherence protein B